MPALSRVSLSQVARLFGGLLAALAGIRLQAQAPSETANPGLLFYLSADRGTTADLAAAGTAEPNFSADVTTIPNGARGPALQCANLQRLSWWAPGNIYAQRGTLAFFWRSREPVGPTEFPIFRVGYADHSSWDMVWLRIDYNGHGFDAFVTDASLARTRVSVSLPKFPAADEWVHLALAWDETRGIRFYVNGRLAAENKTTARYDAALDQFGPHSRVISPYQVQSDYNFVRGGDIDEIRIYDRMVGEDSVAILAKGEAPAALDPVPSRSLADEGARAEWLARYGWERPDAPPPHYAARAIAVRKVEIHDVYDLKRWWWKATDGIRETTWPGVYNRSRIAGRNDYFQLPDWDCYVDSGKAVTFALPNEPVNHIEISGAAWGKMELLPAQTENETADAAVAESALFERAKGHEKTVHAFETPVAGRKIRFTNVEQEQPIGELGAYHVTAGAEPAGSARRVFKLTAINRAPLNQASRSAVETVEKFIAGRHPPGERAMLAGNPESVERMVQSIEPESLPLTHIVIPNTWDDLTDGLDGIAIDLPPFTRKPTHGTLLPVNIQVKDPLWPLRNLCDFSFSFGPHEKKTVWLDLRDRLLPKGKPLYLTVTAAGEGLWLGGAEVRLIFKPREAARGEHELDRFTQARDSYAMLVEEHPRSAKYNLWNRFEADLTDLLRVNPEHELGRQYAAVGMGAARPPFVQPEAPAGVPLWAFRQTELLGRVKQFVLWYIDHRQAPYGDFGGGISDDVDLTNTWPAVALMGGEPEKIKASLQALLDAAYKNGMFTNGLPTIQADELHSYEEGINCLAQNLLLDFGSPRQLERAMETARGVAGITGINAAGHRHIRSSYYSGTRIAEDGPWGWSKPYSYLVLHPDYLLIDYNGNPAAKKIVNELADGLLAHYRPGGQRNGVPSAIHFATDAEDEATRNSLPWPLLWSAWRSTGDKKYLAPIIGGGLTTLAAVNGNALDLLSLREEWNRRMTAGEIAGQNETRRPDGRGRSTEAAFRTSQMAHFSWQLSGDKKVLEKLYADQIEQCALLEFINTEGSLWIDRVGLPHSELQRARLGGIALVRNSLYHGHVVSWKFAPPASDQSVAILIPDATAKAFKVIAYNLETKPVQATMTGWDIDPGIWEVTQGIDTNDDDAADAGVATRSTLFERSRSLSFTLPPRATSVVTLKLKSAGTPYWQRPDLGIEAQDVVVQGREIRVTVHSLGSVAAPVNRVVFRDAAGRVVATAPSPALDAPTDLLPKTSTVKLTLPANAEISGGVVEIDPEHALEEITLLNNAVRL
ncbi:MAG TPA: LamG-like jellyroll fold domain-containing protein [Opitutaceae bacterium]|nr:LamG-like jellyroll fold domain-containing protein [Opitutaceae bacterium]